MLEFNEELKNWMLKFKDMFDDIVPLRQISGAVTNEQLIDAIKKSIETGENLLPSIFGYRNSDNKTY